MTPEVQIFFSQCIAAMFYIGICVGIFISVAASSVFTWFTDYLDRRSLYKELDTAFRSSGENQ